MKDFILLGSSLQLLLMMSLCSMKSYLMTALTTFGMRAKILDIYTNFTVDIEVFLPLPITYARNKKNLMD